MTTTQEELVSPIIKLGNLLREGMLNHKYIIIQCSDLFWSALSKQDSEPRLYYEYRTDTHIILRVPPEEFNLHFRYRKPPGVGRPTLAILNINHNNWDRHTDVSYALHPKHGEIVYYD